MELDQLKEVWKEMEKKGTAEKNSGQLTYLPGRRSHSPIAKMKRNLFIELLLVIVLFGGAAVYYFIAFKGRVSEVSWTYIVLALAFCVYYYRKSKLLNEMQCVSCRVKSNLELHVKTLEKYVRFYLIYGTALIPVLFIFFGVLIRYKIPGTNLPGIFYPSAANPWWKAILMIVLVTAAVTLLFYMLNKWYVKKLYGNHIKKLRQVLEEMNDGD